MILVLGAGYVGQAFGGKVISRKDVDYTRETVFSSIVFHQHFEAVVNCAGMTGRPNIDECEEKRAECIRANLILPEMLSKVCRWASIPFVHISSGCIYQGGPHTEQDKPVYGDLSFYSLTKAMAEELIDGYVLRIRMPFGLESHPRSFLTKIRGYEKLIDHPNSLTFLPDLVEATRSLIGKKAPKGIYNVVNSGSASHREIVDIFRHNGHHWNPKFIDDEEFKALVKAPRSNCILTNEKICQYYNMPNAWERLHQAAKHQRAAA